LILQAGRQQGSACGNNQKLPEGCPSVYDHSGMILLLRSEVTIYFTGLPPQAIFFAEPMAVSWSYMELPAARGFSF